MRGMLRRILSVLLVLGMFLQNAQTLAVFATEEIRELENRPNQELMELKEGVIEKIMEPEDYDEDSRIYYLGERRYRTVFGNSEPTWISVKSWTTAEAVPRSDYIRWKIPGTGKI